MTRDADEHLPVLTYEVVSEIGEFPEFPLTVSETDVAAYLDVTGAPPGRPTTIPPGYAAVFGRLGYLKRHRMPGGGVLLGQEIQWVRPAVVGEPLAVRSVVERAEEDERGRRKVVFVTTARQYGEPVATVRITAGWPT